MTEEEFGRLVRRIELSAQRGYARYLRRTLLLGWIGVVFPFALIAITCAVMAMAVALAPPASRALLAKALVLLIAPLYLVARAFVFSWPVPAGVRLEPAEFPELFGLLERLRRKQGAPAPEAVYLDGSFNATVAQQPQRGVFGARRTFLTLGLPLMDSLSPLQLEAVLAHEFGHVTGGRGATTRQIYAMRLTMEKLAGHSRADGDLVVRLVGPFYRRFVRYFDAYSCVAARRVEIEADRAAAAQVGKEVLASALVALSVQDQRIDRDFWEPLAEELEGCALPPVDIYERIAEVAARPLADAAPLLRNALSVVSQSFDTHPSLAERLRALEVAPEAALAPLSFGALRETGSAAGAYLAAGRAKVAADLGKRWASDHSQAWKTARTEGAARRERLAVLDGLAETLTREELHERVKLAYGVDRADVESLALELLARHANDAVAQFYLGSVLADRGDPDALRWLERAAQADVDAIVPAANRAIALLVKLGRVEDAERLADRTVARLDELDDDCAA